MTGRITMYNFWAWQYTARNPTFHERAKRTVEWIESMRREGIINEFHTVKDIANGLYKKGLMRDTIPREPTEEETLFAKELLSYHEYFVGLNYQYDDLKQAHTPANEIIASLDNYLVSLSYPKKKRHVNSWPFAGPETIGKKACPTSKMFKTEIVKHLDSPLGGKCLVHIDFNSPLKTILAEIEAMYHFEYLPQTSDFEAYDASFENCHMRILEAKGETLGKDDAPRIIGLWLWDHLKETETDNVAAAIRVMQDELGKRKGNGVLDSLGRSRSSNRRFSEHLKKTEACIEACEVLPFSNKSK